MKCYTAILLLAVAAVAIAEKPIEKPIEKPTTKEAEPVVPSVETAPRDKRSSIITTYTAPLTYSAYAGPIGYSASYSLPYAYTAYRGYPYYYPAPYIYG